MPDSSSVVQGLLRIDMHLAPACSKFRSSPFRSVPAPCCSVPVRSGPFRFFQRIVPDFAGPIRCVRRSGPEKVGLFQFHGFLPVPFRSMYIPDMYI